MILADTSIWIEMFRRGGFQSELDRLIVEDQLVIHPCITVELACGSLPNRIQTLANLDRLVQLPAVRLDDLRYLIESRRLYAKGIGLTDVHLIASCLANPGTLLWTLDGALGRVAAELGIRHQPG